MEARDESELEGFPQPVCCAPASPFRTPRHSRAPSRVTYVNMSSEVFETDIIAATTTHDDLTGTEEPKQRLWRTRGLLVAGWMCSLVLIIVLATLLFTGNLHSGAGSAGSIEETGEDTGSQGPRDRPGRVPSVWPADTGATCLQGRSHPLHGSGPAICYQGATTASSVPPPLASILPGDGACAFCVAGARSGEADQCIACYEGFELSVMDSKQCSGRCIPASQAGAVARPEDVCSAPADTGGCAVHGDPLLCYDHRSTCHYRIEWDHGMCEKGMGEQCRATCKACEGPGQDTHLEGLLLGWKDALTLGPSSPLRWGWQADIAVNRWPGVQVEDPISGAFLRELRLANFDLEGPLFPAWGTLYSPEMGMSWQLQHNRLTGTLPPEWAMALPRIIHLDLSNNQLEGTIPLTWAQTGGGGVSANGDPGHSSWLTLDLGSNRLSGELKAEWFSQGTMRRVVSLTLENNQLQGSLPAQWSLLHLDLERLDIRNNSLTSLLPPEYSVFSNLYYLLLGRNGLTGSLPAAYSTMANLRSIDVSHNKLSGALPKEWSAMNTWGSIWRLGHNSFTGGIPEEWSNFDPQAISLQSNRLTGPLPEWVSRLTGLVELDLSDNNLEGTLPQSWSLCTALRRLLLGKNSLTGTVPKEWSALELLDLLGLQGNEGLHGAITMADGVHVLAEGTALDGAGDAGDVWDRHRARWEAAAGADGDSYLDDTPWMEDGQCSFCKHVPEVQGRCTCVRNCCRSLGDKSLCSQQFDEILGSDDCHDPCGYCWSLALLPDRAACFHSCCADIDDDDMYPLYSNACVVSREFYAYDYDDDN